MRPMTKEGRNRILLCGHMECEYARDTGAAKNANGGFAYCDYIGVTGHLRPCKPTSDCQCYKKKSRGRKKKNKAISIKGWCAASVSVGPGDIRED